ncbi:hypothetical protein V1506DRAFT_569131 [Lipomyces tetrasporus]
MVRLLIVYTISTFVVLAGVLFGFDISHRSIQNFFGDPLGTRQGGITSGMAAGSLVGALSSSFFWCIGAATQSASNGVAMLIAGRIVSGVCIVLTSSLVPIYQSEIAPHKIRGRIIVFQTLAITAGIMIQYFIQYGCSFIDSEAAFRIPWAIQAIPAIFLIIGLFWLPRSPASVDRWDEALQVLAYLRTGIGDINDPLVLAEYKEIEDQISTEREENSNSYRELFSRKIRKRLFLSMALQMWSQLRGMNVADSAGIANTTLASSIQYIINMVMTIPCLIWTDKWGRRPSLLVGAVFMSIWFFIIGGLLLQYGEPNPVANEPWIYPPEVAPLHIRAKSIVLATATNWVTNFALGFAVPPLLRSLKWGMFFLFGVFNLAAFINPLWKSFTGMGDTNRLDRLAREIEVGLLTVRHKPDG